MDGKRGERNRRKNFKDYLGYPTRSPGDIVPRKVLQGNRKRSRSLEETAINSKCFSQKKQGLMRETATSEKSLTTTRWVGAKKQRAVGRKEIGVGKTLKSRLKSCIYLASTRVLWEDKGPESLRSGWKKQIGSKLEPT